MWPGFHLEIQSWGEGQEVTIQLDRIKGVVCFRILISVSYSQHNYVSLIRVKNYRPSAMYGMIDRVKLI